ncbi:uncharacterized protein LOC121756359 isoform X1 [Salvia splendens]|uniref:uncharacterized protein LOC121756359 isoform X1 n=1 Tax=Salvia splendens TaxID=180675 RepID=UPI001C25192B|nr:uncharacterized protein LOC121756359 isoform X1 [Salvia splendens]
MASYSGAKSTVSDVPKAVFTETNLGTRLAVSISPDITADDFRRVVERAHLNCFPDFGAISVKAVMVMRKLHLYHLSGSLPLKYAFLDSNATWFLQTDVIFSNVPTRVESSNHNEAEVHKRSSAATAITDSVELGGASFETKLKCKRKKAKIRRFTYLGASMLKISAAWCFRRKKKRKNVKKIPKTRHHRRGRTQQSLVEKELFCEFATGAGVNLGKKADSNVIAEATSETVSEPASVSGIIKKYFSDYDEVASGPVSMFTTSQYIHRKPLSRSNRCEYHNNQMKSPVTVHVPPQTVHIPPPQVSRVEMPRSGALREKRKRPDIGKRLVLASGSLGLSPSNQHSILSLCRYNDEELPFQEF